MAERILRCPKCGGEIRHTSAFCEHCGSPVQITVATVQEEIHKEATPEDTEKAKAKAEYFKKRSAAAQSSTRHKSDADEGLSIDAETYFSKAAKTGGLLLGMNLVAVALAFCEELVTKISVIGLLVAGFILPIILRPLFKSAVAQVNRRKIRRLLRFILCFNWIACGGPLYVFCIMILENFFELSLGGVSIHVVALLGCYAVGAIIALIKFFSLRVNKSMTEICMTLHFDNYSVTAFAMFAIVIYIFAIYV